ncbi:MAG: glycosyltransferase, partial [Nitrospirae bacterium]|nr:glycosyltransferase [Nitrospirota bacterium]
TVYNGEGYLRASIESILNQTFGGFEFLIIDDCSTDSSSPIIQSYSDSRIKVVTNPVNLGQTRSLNLGLQLAQGEYLARQDQDDISLPHRLKMQIAYLDDNPDIGILGTSAWIINGRGQYVAYMARPAHQLEVLWSSLFANPFAHPSVMMRTRILRANRLTYDAQFHYSQDYALWCQFLKFSQGANLREPLIKYRIHNSNASYTRAQAVTSEARAISKQCLREYFPEDMLSEEELHNFVSLFIVDTPLISNLQFDRAKIAMMYLDLFQLFTDRHPSSSAIPSLYRHTSLEAIKSVVRPLPVAPGWLRVVWRALQLDVSVLWYFPLWILDHLL